MGRDQRHPDCAPLDASLTMVSAEFPLLTKENNRQSSPADEAYNCIAWAVGVTDSDIIAETESTSTEKATGGRRLSPCEAFVPVTDAARASLTARAPPRSGPGSATNRYRRNRFAHRLQ